MFEVPNNVILDKFGARPWIARIILSDRIGERRRNLFWACMVATAGLVVAGMKMGTWRAVAGLCIATAGFNGAKGPFWSLPSMMLTGTAAAFGLHIPRRIAHSNVLK